MKLAGLDVPGTSFGILGFFVLIAAYYLGSRTGKSKAATASVDELTKGISKSELTYEENQYGLWADRIYDITSGIWNDEETLYAIFAKMRNNSDLMQLIKTFGSRGGFIHGGSFTLQEWLWSDLTKVEVAKVNDILQRNNITYQF